MANRIAGITVQIGGDTTKLSAALKQVNSEMRSTQSELRDVNRLLKIDPGNTELLSQKHKLLNKAILQSLLYKFINGKALQLYHNEIAGVDAFDWKAFPEALIVSDGKLRCGTIEDRLTDIEDLLD